MELTSLFLIVTCLFLIPLLLLALLTSVPLMHGTDTYWKRQKVPIIKIHQMMNFLHRALFRISHLELDLKVYKSLGTLKFGGFMELHNPIFYVKDLDLLRHILVKDFDSFSERKFLGLHHADPIISRTLTNTIGQEWKDMRAATSPVFSSGKIRRMFKLVNVCGHHLVNYLEDAVGNQDDGKIIDFQDCFGRFTVGVITSVGFYQETDVCPENISVFRKMATTFQHFDTPRILRLVAYMFVPQIAKFLNLTVNNTKSTNFFAQVIQENIEKRRADEREYLKGGHGLEDKKKRIKGKHQDFLQLMLDAQANYLEEDDVNNNSNDSKLKGKTSTSTTNLDDQTIIGQCFQFFNAGNDAAEATLIFSVHALALHPEIQEKLAEEVGRVMDANDGELTFESVNEMEYLDKFVSETLRVYPPAFATERRSNRDYQVPGTEIILPKDTRVIIPIRGIHYDERYYEEPEKFNPENFSLENKHKRHPYAYLPFGQGPRSCVAMRFAITEVKSAIAHVVYRFRVEPCSKTDIPAKFENKSFLLLPRNGMYLKVTRRLTKNSHSTIKLNSS